MNFFEAQDLARRRTRLLVVLFALAVAAITGAVYLAVLVAMGTTAGVAPGWDPALFGVVALGTGLLIGLGSAFRSAQLRKGGPAVASLLGGREVSPDTTDPLEKRLVNVVEEMSVASGVPVPAIYVLDEEESINAFAAGHTIHDAAVAVTRGTLEQLDRDELQGVMAHEFSHILNGDMRLNVRLVGLLFGILLLAVVGRGLLYSGHMGRRRRGGDGRAALVGLALLLVGYIGVFFGKLIKAAISRQREYLADAAAVQFTRNPDGIAGALKKIGAHAEGSRVRDHHAEELSHLFFANGLKGAFSQALATHPPLRKRIRRVDPSWDGRFEDEPSRVPRDRGERPSGASASAGAGDADAPSEAGRRSPGDPIFGPLGSAAGGRASGRKAGAGAGGIAEAVAGAAVLMSSVGLPDADHVAYARRLLADVPEPLREAAHDPAGARALVLLLLGGDDGSPAEARREAVESLEEEAVAEWLPVLAPLAEGVPPEARLPLLDLALPALHAVSPQQAARLRSAVQRVIRADGEVRPFDFALVHILWRHLPGGREGARRKRRAVRSLSSLRHDLEVVLSAVIRAGGADKDEEPGEDVRVAQAFQAAVETLPPSMASMEIRPLEAAGLDQVDRALERLERGTLDIRRQVLEACAAAVLADRTVRVEETELLRAVAEALELPLPPFLPTDGSP